MSFRLSNSYHSKTTSSRRLVRTVDKVAKIIKELQKEYKISHIACTGISGQSVAWPVSYITKIPVVVIRKSREASHGYTIEGQGIIRNYIIIDDFIGCGNTMRRIMSTLSKKEAIHADIKTIKCKHIILYNASERRRSGEFNCIPVTKF